MLKVAKDINFVMEFVFKITIFKELSEQFLK